MAGWRPTLPLSRRGPTTPPTPLVATASSPADGGAPPSLFLARRWLPLVLASSPAHSGGDDAWTLAPLPPAAGGASLPPSCGAGVVYGGADGVLDATAVVVG